MTPSTLPIVSFHGEDKWTDHAAHVVVSAHRPEGEIVPGDTSSRSGGIGMQARKSIDIKAKRQPLVEVIDTQLPNRTRLKRFNKLSLA